MLKDLNVPLFDMLQALANAMDLVNPTLVDHHKRVAYMASSLAGELGFSREEQNLLLMAGMLHDSGVLSLAERIGSLQFEEDNPHRHAELGYRLLKGYGLFARIAPLVRFHHVPWDNGRGSTFNGHQVPVGSHVLHLADRAAVLISMDRPILTQVREIREKIAAKSGDVFVPDLVQAFQHLAGKECFWLDAVSPALHLVLSRRARTATVDLSLEGLLDLTRLFGKIIDFRSPFTATHSLGVAATAEALACFMGFSETEARMIRIAGHLHDLGKLAVPVEILEKPGRLAEDEFNVVKGHTFYSFRILETIPGLETINAWGSFHHERLDGNGYPFHRNASDLPLGSRIISVADVFTALIEDRPYRPGVTAGKAMEILEDRVTQGALDKGVVSVLTARFDEVNSARAAAQSAAAGDFKSFNLKEGVKDGLD